MCRSCHRSKDRRRRHDERQDHSYEAQELGGSGRISTRCRVCHNRRQRAYMESKGGAAAVKAEWRKRTGKH